MKKFYSCLLFSLCVSSGFAQIPSNYYDSANGLSGYTLKTQLKNIISAGYIQRTYNQLYDGVGITGSNGYIDTHSDLNVSSGTNYENDGTILDFYSENPTGVDPYNYTHGFNQCGNQTDEGDCYNREHLVPQSSYNEAFPMRSDIHQVIPTDGRVNNFRGSLPFGIVDVADFTSLNGSKRGTSAVSGYAGTVFEPIDEFKGDIARALLYFAVRYEDTVDDYTSFVMFNGTEDEVFFPWAIDLLLDWHYNVDPVDQRERDRNEAAYAFQNNANPFVDRPEFAAQIWNPTSDTEAPTAPTNLIASNPTLSTIDLAWTASTDNVAVTAYDIYVDDVFTTSTSNTSIVITGLAADTEFCFTVFARDAALNTSTTSNEACESTVEGSSTANELFISEYVEGSGNNKAIEIANFTGAVVNLGTYSIARDTNSNGIWTGTVNLSGNLADGDVYVIARGNADPAILNVADQLVGNGQALDFNGDDPVGLFKNVTLIDIFGNFGGSNDFENATFRRKPEVASPTTAFDLTGEWDEFPNDTFNDLGSHTQTLSNVETEIEKLRIYPNPAKGDFLFISSPDKIDFKIYSITGKIVNQGTILNGRIELSNLKKGIYILRLKKDNISSNFKLIRL